MIDLGEMKGEGLTVESAVEEDILATTVGEDILAAGEEDEDTGEATEPTLCSSRTPSGRPGLMIS